MPDYGISFGTAPMYQGEVSFSSGVAVTLFDIPLPTAGDRCSGTVHFSIQCSDGTDYQNITHVARFSAVNKAGTLTGDFTYDTTGQSKNTTTGTLTTTATDTTTATTTARFQMTPTSSLTLTSAVIRFTIISMFGSKPSAITTT